MIFEKLYHFISNKYPKEICLYETNQINDEPIDQQRNSASDMKIIDQPRERKSNACTFCGKVIKEIGDHLQQQHANENTIREISKFKPKDPEKRKRLGLLVAQGNLKHNEKVRVSATDTHLRENNGDQLIPKYKKTKINGSSNYLVSCQKCGFIYSSESSLKTHRCPASGYLTVNLPRIDLTQIKTNINADQVPVTMEKALSNDSDCKDSNFNQPESVKLEIELHEVLDLDEMIEQQPNRTEISSRVETEKLDVTVSASNAKESDQEEIFPIDEIHNIEINNPEIFSKEPVRSTRAEIIENATHITDEANKCNIDLTELKDDFEFPFKKKKRENLDSDVTETNSTDHKRSKPVLYKSKQINIREILDPLRDDEISEIVRTDKMILMFGEEKLRGVSTANFNNNYQGQLNHIRQIMRRAGKYLYHFRKVIGDPCLTLEESFKNHIYHDKLPEIGVRLSDNYTKPYNIDNTRKALGNMLKVFKLRQHSNEIYNQWTNIKERFADSWQSLNEQARTGKMEMNKKRKMPFPSKSDYKRLIQYVEKHLKKYMKKNITTYKEYLQLSRLVHTKITIFNYRRSGEVARMTIDEFERRESRPFDAIEEVKDQLTKLDYALATSVDIVTLKGKSSKNELVQAVLLPDDQDAILEILKCRNQFSSLHQNKFVFATDGPRKYHLNGYKAVKKIVTKSGVKNIHVFTAGKLRKHLATKMVWMKFDDALKKNLISHLGHLPSMHENVYEEHVRSAFGRFTKLSAALYKEYYAYNNITKETELLECLRASSDRLSMYYESESTTQNPESNSSNECETCESDTDTKDESTEEKIPTQPLRSSNRLRAHSQKINYNFTSSSEKNNSSESEYEFSSSKKKKCLRKKRKTIPQTKWNSTMNRILVEIFHDELQNKEPIKNKKLQKCQLRFTKEVGKTVSTSSIKGKLWQIRSGNYRKLETE